MKRRHKGLLGLLLAAPLSLGSGAITFGSIQVSKIVGDPLIANRKQSLTFTINHQGYARNIFDFVFSVKRSNKVVFSMRKSYFKVPNGIYEVSTTIPASVLQEGVVLGFEIKFERYYNANSYVCYSVRKISQTPKATGKTYRPDGEQTYLGFNSIYYPSNESKTCSYFKFFGVQKKRDVNSRRLHLEDIRFQYGFVPEGYTAVKKEIGQLRIQTRLDYWKIGARVWRNSYVYLPLTYEYSEGFYRLQLSQVYSFSQETGEMMELKAGYPRTRDLILPYWANEENPVKITIALVGFNPASESVIFEKEAYYDGSDPLNGYTVHWEEK